MQSEGEDDQIRRRNTKCLLGDLGGTRAWGEVLGILLLLPHTPGPVGFDSQTLSSRERVCSKC